MTVIPKAHWRKTPSVMQPYLKTTLNKYKMSRLRRQISANTANVAETKDLNVIRSKTGNVYESIAIIAKRANQINISLKEELHNKLEEFASHTDSLEEIHENKEQIEISRAYERMPNPSLLATQEFLEDKIYYRKNEDDLFS
jgi:DNA-directed RNA polymerase subunit K/omega